jgi:hypothetical protein
MASEVATKGGQALAAVLRFLKVFILNLWRRFLMLGHYTINCFHQQRLRRAWRTLGKRVHQALEGGEVNPMLAGDVKDSLTKAQAIEMAKDRHYQAIAALREKIRATRAGEATPPPEAEQVSVKEPEPAPAEAAEPATVKAAEPAPTEAAEPPPSKEPGPEQPQS